LPSQATTLEASRAQLHARARRQEAAAPPPWEPLKAADFRQHRCVLSFDATLTNCGWVFFAVLLGRVTVIRKGTIKPKTAQVGYLATWDKAHQLRSEVDELVGRWRRNDPRCHVVVEAPSVGGGSRTESSLIAGMLVWSRPGNCHVVSATHVSAVLLGDPKVRSAERKKRVKAEIGRLCPETAGRDWNEHERDALATGLVHLYDNKGESR
jgi:hypothetical protein